MVIEIKVANLQGKHLQIYKKIYLLYNLFGKNIQIEYKLQHLIPQKMDLRLFKTLWTPWDRCIPILLLSR